MRPLLGLLLLSLASSPALADDRSLPELGGDTLAGTPVSLPAALTAPATLVLVTTKRAQQEQVDDWLRHIGELRPGAAVPWWQVTVMPHDLPGLVFSMVRMAMSASLDDAREPRTLVIRHSHAALRAALPGTASDEVVVLLVDPRGHVLAAERGGYTVAKGGRLRRALSRVTSPP